MGVKIDDTFSLKGVTSNICMLYDDGDHEITRAVIGRIRTRATQGRETADLKCGSGFVCAYLPFARGHVIALELGGSDNPYNVVPQFERWQNKAGRWREMEEEIQKKYNGRLMVVEIGYGRSGGIDTHASLRVKFEGDPFVSWTDRLIPDKFTVRVIDHALDPSTLTSPALFAAAIAALVPIAAIQTWEFTFPASGVLAEEDEAFLARDAAAQMAHQKYADADDGLKRAFSAASTFIFAPGVFSQVKDDLAKEYPNLRPTVRQAISPFDVYSDMEVGVTRPKLKKKVQAKRKEKIGLDDAAVAAAGIDLPPAAAAPAPKGGLKKKAKGGD